jgi:hypothetical protein
VPRRSSISRDSILALALFVAAATGCSDQDPVDDGPPVDTKTLWTVRAGGGGDFTNLQEGVNAASNGDTVLVGPGRYANLSTGVVGGIRRVFALYVGGSNRVRSKAVTLIAEAGPDSTIIGGESIVDFTVVFEHTPGGMLSGFTIDGGGNGGVLVSDSKLEIAGNRFVNSTSAVRAEDGVNEMTLRSNRFVGNLYGISAVGTTIATQRNLFEGNSQNGISLVATTATLRGDTVRASGKSGLSFTNSGVTAEEILVEGSGGAACDLTDATLALSRSTIVLNGRGLDPRDGITLSGASSHLTAENTIIAHSGGCGVRVNAGIATLTCCDLWDNLGGDGGIDCASAGQNGTFSINPLFCDLNARDYRLRTDSPCAPENAGDCGLIGAFPVACEPESTASR